MSVQQRPLFCDPSKLTISSHRVGASIRPLACNPRAAELSYMMGALTSDVYFSDWLRKTVRVHPNELHNYSFDLVVQSDRALFCMNGHSYRFAGLLQANEGEIAAHLSSRVSRSLTEQEYNLTQKQQAHVQREHFIPIIAKAEEIFGSTVSSVGFQTPQEPTQVPVAPGHSSELAAMRELFAQLSAQKSADHQASLATIARGHQVSTQALVQSQNKALDTQSADHRHVIDHLMALIRDFQQRQEKSGADIVSELASRRQDLARLKDKLSAFQKRAPDTEAENKDLRNDLTDLQGTLKQATVALEEKRAECAGLRHDQQSLQKNLSALKAEKRALESELTKVSSEHAQSPNRAHSSRAESQTPEDLTKTLTKADRLASDLSDNQSLLSDLDKLKTELEATQTKLIAAQTKNHNLTEALAKNQSLFTDTAKAKQKLATGLKESDTALKEALSQRKALDLELAEAKASVENLKEDLNTQVKIFAIQIADIEATRLEQSRALKSLDAEKKESAKGIRDLSQQLKAAQEKIRELTSELSDKKRHYAEADAKITDQAGLISTQKEERALLNATLTKEKSQARKIEKALATAEEKHSRLENNFDALCIQLKEQEQIIAELRKPGIDFDAMLKTAMTDLVRKHAADIEKLTSQIAFQENVIKDLKVDHKAALAKISEELTQTQEKLTAAHLESDAFNQAYSASETARQAAIQSAVRDATAKLEDRVDELLKERAALKAGFDENITKAWVFTKELLTQKEQSIQRYQEQVATLEADRANLNEQLAAALKLAEEKPANQILLTEKNENLSGYTDQIAKLEAQIAEAIEREDNLEAQLKVNEELIDQSEIYSQKMLTENKILKTQVSELEMNISKAKEKSFETGNLPEGYNAEQMTFYMAERTDLIREHLKALNENEELITAHKQRENELSELRQIYKKCVKELESAKRDVQNLTGKETHYQQQLTNAQEQYGLLEEENRRLEKVDNELKRARLQLGTLTEEAEESARAREQEDQQITADIASLRKKITNQNSQLRAISEEKKAAISKQKVAEDKLTESQEDIALYDKAATRINELEALVSTLIKATSGKPQDKIDATAILQQSAILADIVSRN